MGIFDFAGEYKMKVRENRILKAMREGRKAYGYNLVFPSPWVVEVLGYEDFDFVWIDGEHGPWGLDQIEDVCRVAAQVGVTPVARVPDIGSSTILRYLDRGVQGIMGPHISTKADAEQLVKACYFGPDGDRSFGGNRGTEYDFIPSDEKVQYYKDSNDNMLVGALLEDKAVIDELDGILEVKGIDYMSIGHNDFAQSIGYPGDSDNPAVQDQMNRIYDRIRAAGGHVAADIMVTDWVHGMLRRAGQELLAGK